MEETGLSIRNIIYFDNQPWPYPSGLMMGFVADYAGGEIKLQDEISFTISDLVIFFDNLKLACKDN